VGTYFTIITCRNSEDNITQALKSIKQQTLKPEYIIVIDDGSTDKTPELLLDLQKDWDSLHIISHPASEYDIKRVVRNWNEALKLAKMKGLSQTAYHMIATDDTVYSNSYAEKIISYMDLNAQLGIVSGTYSKYAPIMPHGAGRFVRNSFFENSCWSGYYPEQMGYESAVLYEANRCGFGYAVLDDATFKHTKALGKDHKFYEFGASMHTLGYHPLFVIARFLKYFTTGKVTGRVGSLYMLYYYFKYQAKSEGYDRMYDETIRKFVRKRQVDRLRRLLFLKLR